jgi:hypothetical protein
MLRAAVVGFGLSVLAAAPAFAGAEAIYELSLKADAFTPGEIKVPAGKPFVIEFTNGNTAPAELEAKELDIEKIAPAGAKINVRVRAMPAGKYLFVDEFQEATAKGYIIVE